jgi:hypothetical protein
LRSASRGMAGGHPTAAIFENARIGIELGSRI